MHCSATICSALCVNRRNPNLSTPTRPNPYTHRMRRRAKGRYYQNHHSSTDRRVGLARALSKLGYCSRTQAADLIRSGQVKLNSVVRRDPETPVHLGKDKIAVAGSVVGPATKRYLILNKPRGLVTTADDEQSRATIYDCLLASDRIHFAGTNNANWIAPVGRLDKASEGLLLLTNDTEWAARVTSPESRLDKIYHVQIAATPGDALLKTLEGGVSSEGKLLRAKCAAILREGDRTAWLEITLDEGKNRHIRRMFSTLGIEVLRLIRVAIGPLALGNLPKGATRQLTPSEKSQLDRAMSS
jgi:23S rRNA pseudouridine2605 synthase